MSICATLKSLFCLLISLLPCHEKNCVNVFFFCETTLICKLFLDNSLCASSRNQILRCRAQIVNRDLVKKKKFSHSYLVKWYWDPSEESAEQEVLHRVKDINKIYPTSSTLPLTDGTGWVSQQYRCCWGTNVVDVRLNGFICCRSTELVGLLWISVNCLFLLLLLERNFWLLKVTAMSYFIPTHLDFFYF